MTDITLAKIEALLFAATDPLDINTLAQILGISEIEVDGALRRLQEETEREDRGIRLNRVAGGFELVTKPQFAELISRLSRPKNPPPLSQAALETLAIVLYQQPVTKAEIELLRGVRSDAAIDTLIARGLIEELGRKEVPGRPILYGTTDFCLKYLGIQDRDRLPPLPDQQNSRS
ncbi:MAG: SMC-Scp complex subunit ScpB [Bacillota bacterium]